MHIHIHIHTGVLPAICSNIYPAGVRISGFNFAYNFGISTFGGLVRGTGMGFVGCLHARVVQVAAPDAFWMAVISSACQADITTLCSPARAARTHRCPIQNPLSTCSADPADHDRNPDQLQVHLHRPRHLDDLNGCCDHRVVCHPAEEVFCHKQVKSVKTEQRRLAGLIASSSCCTTRVCLLSRAAWFWGQHWVRTVMRSFVR